MANILTYLKRFGHLDFEQRPFGETDALVLASMSYMMFEGVVPRVSEDKRGVAINKMASEYLLNRMLVNTLDPFYNRILWRLMISSVRFGAMTLNFCRNKIDMDSEEQFSAVTCMFPDGTAHICYRGTDLTLIGWKEDFNMSVAKEVPAQADAVEYFNRVAEKTDGKLYVCGHSKGGNLAHYAAMYCDPSAQSRLAHVYNFDGPGFRRDISRSKEAKRIDPILSKFVPKQAIVGLLMHHTPRYKVVKCRGVGLLQHDPYNWKIDKDGNLASVSVRARSSELFERTSAEWMKSMQGAQRTRFVELVFTILGANEGLSVVDYFKRPVSAIRKLRKRYKSLKKREKKLVKRCFKNYFSIRKSQSRLMRTERNQAVCENVSSRDPNQ